MGGAGAILSMWMTALTGMATQYAGDNSSYPPLYQGDKSSPPAKGEYPEGGRGLMGSP